MEDWSPSQEDIHRMWRQIVAQHGTEKKHTPEKWQKAYEDFVRCIEGLLIPQSTTAAAPNVPVPLSVSAPVTASSENAVKAVENINLYEEEGASGGAYYAPPKNQGSSEPNDLGEQANEEKLVSMHSDGIEKIVIAVVEVKTENPSEDSSLSSTSSEMSSLVDLSEVENETENEQGDKEQHQESIKQQIDNGIPGAEGGTAPQDQLEEEKEKIEVVQTEGAAGWTESNGAHGETTGEGFSEAELCAFFDNLTKPLSSEGRQTLGLFERDTTNLVKSKISRKKDKKNKKRHH